MESKVEAFLQMWDFIQYQKEKEAVIDAQRKLIESLEQEVKMLKSLTVKR